MNLHLFNSRIGTIKNGSYRFWAPWVSLLSPAIFSPPKNFSWDGRDPSLSSFPQRKPSPISIHLIRTSLQIPHPIISSPTILPGASSPTRISKCCLTERSWTPLPPGADSLSSLLILAQMSKIWSTHPLRCGSSILQCTLMGFLFLIRTSSMTGW